MELVTNTWTNPTSPREVTFIYSDTRKSPLDLAREKFQGPFAHEPKTRWKQNATPVLTRWMAKEPWSNRA